MPPEDPMTHSVPTSSFELTFSPDITLISVVRRFVSTFYGHVLEDKDASSRITVATHELLENACKYSCDGETTLRIEVVDTGAGVRIRTSNRTTPERLADIAAHFTEMSKYPTRPRTTCGRWSRA
jgi:anti-sigma regulatory factor (Ser/Thr protein kinase)